MLTEGFHDVPKGHVATVVSHLEMLAPPQGHSVRPFPDGLTLTHNPKPTLDWYRGLFRLVGEDWLWFGRLTMPEAELSAILTDDNVDVFSLDLDGVPQGLLELDFREEGACELAYFGLGRALIGKGAGRALMSHAIEKAFARGISRFHVHTCTLDSPQALGFYRRTGFKVVRQQIEIAPDPRLLGLLSRDAAPQIPIIE